MLENGFSPRMLCNIYDKATPLHFAAIAGNHDGCKLLMDSGASPNDKDGNECTPYYYAVLRSDMKLVRLFEEYNGDATIVNKVFY